VTQPGAVDILLVEDNARDAELTIRALRKQNLANALFVVHDGVEALDFVFGEGQYAAAERRQHPKVILLDIKLPKVDGLEVLRRIKGDARTRTIPVVMVTSSREHPDVETAFALGANSYVVKPVTFEEFMRSMAEIGHYWLLLNQAPQ
jgi:two-component system response regulator